MKTVIGLTGAYCAGKNAAAAILETLGWYTIDLDKLGHKALLEAKQEVLELLGPDIINTDGTLDRKKIAERVFPDPALLAQYEALVHPVMFKLLDHALDTAPANTVCINAAILYKIPQVKRCTMILLITSPCITRLIRGIRRDRRSIREIINKMLVQKKLFKQKPKGIPIKRIHNSGNLHSLKQNIMSALHSV